MAEKSGVKLCLAIGLKCSNV